MTAPRHLRGKLVAIVGPTASGKTGAAIEVARHVPAEVISADSRQIRSGMCIGTAAPTAQELEAVPHHLVGTTAPDATWSLAEFLASARGAIEGAWERNCLPLLVGGTGQYVWALLEGWQIPEVPANHELRATLEALAIEPGGPEALRARLEALDPASAARIAPQNLRRIIRAIEIAETTGRPVQPLERRTPDFEWRVIGLEWARDEIHRRADARAAGMYEAGLLEETRALIERYGPELPALATIGYSEAVRVVRGEWTVSFASDDPRIEWLPGRDLGAVVASVERFVGAESPSAD